MALTRNTLQKVGGAGGNAPSLFTYSTNDTAATCDTSGYFDDASDILKVGDMILGYFDADGTPTFGVLGVASNAAGVVDTKNVVSLGSADSD